LFTKNLDLMDSLSLDFNQRLEKAPATYSIRKSHLKAYTITGGHMEYNTLLSADVIPRRITLALLDNRAYIGDKTKSPFNFQPFDVREITVSAMGKNWPNVPYVLDYPNHKYVRPFYDLCESVGVANTTDDNGISFAMFGKSHAIYSFNLTNSMEDEQFFELIKNGSTNVIIKFDKAVPAGGIILVVYMESDGICMIDKNRALSSDNTI